MKRIVLATSVAIAVTSLVAAPSLAVAPVDSAMTGTARPLVTGAQVGASPAAIYVPADDLAKQLRDKMPFISAGPSVVGNDLVWTVNIAPMRVKAKKGFSRLDRVGGHVRVSKPGVDIANIAFEGKGAGRTLFAKEVPPRLITKAGDQQFSVTLPANVAAELRALPKSKLIHRVGVSVWNDKDTNAATPGYDRTQLTNSFLHPSISTYLASRRPGASGVRSTQSSNTPGTIVVYNGSPFDLNVSGSAVQCQVPFAWFSGSGSGAGTLASNSSLELFSVSQVQGDSGDSYWYAPQDVVDMNAQRPSNDVGAQALKSIGAGILVNHITDNFAKGIRAAVSAFSVGLILKGVIGTIAALSDGNNQCIDAGSAMTFAWSNASVGSSQTAGNVNYWVPTFNRTSAMGGVPPTSIPAVSVGSPLTGYNATSANGLAVSPEVLQRELGLGGTVTLATRNTGNKGAPVGSNCVYTDQQTGNPSSSNYNTVYGSSSLGGGSTADWGPCVSTTVSTGSNYNTDNYYVDGPGVDLMNRGMTLMVGYSTTAYATAGPSPALPVTTAASAADCVKTTRPCTFVQAATTTMSPVVGCTPGTWNMLTPWSPSNPSMNLSSPPSAYQAYSELMTQLGFTGVTATGTPVTMFVPADLGGRNLTSFSPSAVSEWQLTPSIVAGVQQALGGAGGYVTQWLCVMTAESSIPAGILPPATSMNLGWYGVPVVAPIPNPPGNVLSPPA